MHQTWGMATMTVGFVAVNLGIWVAGVGWPYYLLFALEVTVILGFTSLQKPQQVSAFGSYNALSSALGYHSKTSFSQVVKGRDVISNIKRCRLAQLVHTKTLQYVMDCTIVCVTL